MNQKHSQYWTLDKVQSVDRKPSEKTSGTQIAPHRLTVLGNSPSIHFKLEVIAMTVGHWFRHWQDNSKKHRLAAWWSLGVLAGALVWGIGSPGITAERIVLFSGTWRKSVTLEEITTFAETGETSPTLDDYFQATKHDPTTVIIVLTSPVAAELSLLDQGLNNFVGDILLDQLGTVIRTPANRSNREALRSALILSAKDDNRISLLELMQNYPTPEIWVDGDRLAEANRLLQQITSTIPDWLKF